MVRGAHGSGLDHVIDGVPLPPLASVDRAVHQHQHLPGAQEQHQAAVWAALEAVGPLYSVAGADASYRGILGRHWNLRFLLLRARSHSAGGGPSFVGLGGWMPPALTTFRRGRGQVKRLHEE